MPRTGSFFDATHRMWGQYYAMWGTIQWIRHHQEYLYAAETVAEYATKTALFRYLPPSRAQYYAHTLSHMGFDVDSAGIGALGQRALEMAVPAISEIYASVPHQSSDATGPAAFLAGNAAVSIIHHIIEQIREIANMATENDEGHRKMARFIQEAQSTNPEIKITQAAFTKAAMDAYGKGAHWLALALPDIEHKGGVMLLHQADRLAAELKLAYTHWTAWARRFLPALNHLQARASHFALELKPPQPASHGLFVSAPSAAHSTAAAPLDSQPSASSSSSSQMAKTPHPNL